MNNDVEIQVLVELMTELNKSITVFEAQVKSSTFCCFHIKKLKNIRHKFKKEFQNSRL